MAVLVQFTTVLIRIDRLTAASPRGVELVQANWSPSWRDEHLLAVAFMDMGARDLAQELEAMGLVLRDLSSGVRQWRDICVVDYYDGPTNPCPWLEYDPTRHVAWLKGQAEGGVVGPEHRHEEAPVRVSPAQFQQLMQQQHPAAQQPAAAAPAAPRRKAVHHEAVLLPLTQQIADQLLQGIPLSAKIEAVILLAHFARPGEVATTGLVLHELDGEQRAMPLRIVAEARRLLDACSRYESGNRLTSIEIKIAGDGECITSFGIAPPKSIDELKAHLERIYGNVPAARAPTLPASRGFMGWVRGLFGPKLKLHPQPALRHRPQREPLSLLLDPLTGIHEGWDEDAPPSAAQGSSASAVPKPSPAQAASLLAQLHGLEAARTGTAAAPVAAAPVAAASSGEHLVVPEREGVLLAEARAFDRVPLSELHRSRPQLRFDAIEERLVGDLSAHGLGELHFGSWQGNLHRIDLHVDDIPGFDALLVRLQPVLTALGGLGPITSALGTTRPGQIREVTPVTLAELRQYLVADSPYGSKVYPCWLLGAPPHTRVSLHLSVRLVEGRQVHGYVATIQAA